MSDPIITATPLTAEAFAPFGEVLVASGESSVINQGQCRRFNDLVGLDFSSGRAGISLFQAEIHSPPYSIVLMERHPLGSQCFIPMQGSHYVVAVASDRGGAPGPVRVFLANGSQGVNYRRNVWHAVLTPISGTGLFAVVDRIGEGANLEEYWFETPLKINLGDDLD